MQFCGSSEYNYDQIWASQIIQVKISIPACNYMFKVNNKDIRATPLAYKYTYLTLMDIEKEKA